MVVVGVVGGLVELVLVVVFVPDHAACAVTEEVLVAVGVGGLDRGGGIILRIGDCLVLGDIRQVVVQARVLMPGFLVEDAFFATVRLDEPSQKAHAVKRVVVECPVGQVAGGHHQGAQLFALEFQGEQLFGFRARMNVHQHLGVALVNQGEQRLLEVILDGHQPAFLVVVGQGDAKA
ncbi:hypothetical protein D9M71_356470 [compost metagenome]